MSQTSVKPFICIGSFNPPQNLIIQGLLFHSFCTWENWDMEVKNFAQGYTACKSLWSLNLKPAQGYLPDPLTTVQTCLIHFQNDCIRTPTNHEMNSKMYWVWSEKQVAVQHRFYIVCWEFIGSTFMKVKKRCYCWSAGGQDWRANQGILREVRTLHLKVGSKAHLTATLLPQKVQ